LGGRFKRSIDDEGHSGAGSADLRSTAQPAPHKELVPLNGAGHWAPIFQSDAFLNELRTRVEPLLR
jgi:pimeloyl-ACP methyl ester carboxylesterase